MHTNPNEQHSDFFRYTSGRWLWGEEQQLLDRFKVFDIGELQRVAARTVNANACLDMQKCGEGGYNKVFRLTMDNGVAVIARIPNPNAGPVGYTTASEVATMDFVSELVSSCVFANGEYRLEPYFKSHYRGSSPGIPE